MGLRWVVIAGCIVLSTESALAQDPVSGTWIGDMAPVGTPNRQPITVTLKLDGSAVTGTVTGPPQPGTIRTGTYDAATGALRFDVEVTEGAQKSIFSFDGIVVEDIALGRVSSGGVNGNFRISKGGAAPAARQQGSVTPAQLEGGFKQVNEWIAKAVALVPADKYAYRPTQTVRTFGQLVAHIADSYQWYCASAKQDGVQWSDAIEKGRTDKATVAKKLEEAAAACATVYGSGGNAKPLVENIAHTNLHYGNIITYMRMMGLVPPSS